MPAIGGPLWAAALAAVILLHDPGDLLVVNRRSAAAAGPSPADSRRSDARPGPAQWPPTGSDHRQPGLIVVAARRYSQQRAQQPHRVLIRQGLDHGPLCAEREVSTVETFFAASTSMVSRPTIRSSSAIRASGAAVSCSAEPNRLGRKLQEFLPPAVQQGIVILCSLAESGWMSSSLLSS